MRSRPRPGSGGWRPLPSAERSVCSPSTVCVSAALFCTLQIHAYWSNDPVANYPLVGFGGAMLGLLVLITIHPSRPAPGAVHDRVRNDRLRCCGLVLRDEHRCRHGRRPDPARRCTTTLGRSVGRATAIVGAAAVVLAPVVLVTIGRQITGDRAATYGGTTIRLGREADRDALVTAWPVPLPGMAWRLSIRTLGGTLGWCSWRSASWCCWSGSPGTSDHWSHLPGGLRFGTDNDNNGNDNDNDAHRRRSIGWLAGAFVAALVVYWCFAVAILGHHRQGAE